MPETVIIVGGGVAGLTAAHELIERGYKVHLYERRTYYGGKAASQRDDTGALKDPGSGRPKEHGFRFYPGWYRHLPDTLSRIRYRGSRSYQEAKTVLDNLVPIERETLTWSDRDAVNLPTHLPWTLGQAKMAATFFAEFTKLGLLPGELTFFIHQMTKFLATPDARRAELFENVTWWDYLEADSKSVAYQQLILATTRLMVAAKAKEASAYSIGRLVLRTFADALTSIDRVMDGPTNEVWIDPWVDQLRGLGVTFHSGWELDTIEFHDPAGINPPPPGALRTPSLTSVDAVHFSRGIFQQLLRVKNLFEDIAKYLQRVSTTPFDRTAHDQIELKRSIEEARRLVPVVVADPWWQTHTDPANSEVLVNADRCLKAIGPLLDRAETTQVEKPHVKGPPPPEPKTAEELRQAARLLEDVLDLVDSVHPSEHADFDSARRAVGDYFIFALPVEQMAYYVNRSAAMTLHDPSLAKIVLLSEFTDWMAGIQFYLREPFDFAPGHIVCMDSQWSLTAIEHTQFWRDINLRVRLKEKSQRDVDIRAVLSVDIAAWDAKGRFVRLEAFNCSDEQIATEVWNQLKASINRYDKVQWLRDDMLIDGPKLQRGINYNLDDAVADVFDRKKQAVYENARSVEFSSEELVKRQRASGQASQAPYLWGSRLEFNTEPLLVNRVGSLALRPEAATAIPNLFLAADYVRTDTDLACMEGANEAARRAVNALLDASSSQARRCQIWSLSVARDMFEHMTALATSGAARSVAERAAKAAGQMTDGLAGIASQAWANLRAMRKPL